MNGITNRPGAWIDAIRIKNITRELRDGRECIVRKRGAGTKLLVKVANWFFPYAQNPARVCESDQEWQKWEVNCFQLLNGRDVIAFAEGPAAVVTEILPGKSLAQYFEEGSFQEAMLDSAARELKRAHQLECPELNGKWSHGDANLTNFLFDPITGRTGIIDFEVIHDAALSAEERHAEDLLVFLQDLCGCIDVERWLPAALRFLKKYDSPQVIAHLKRKLVVARGIPRLWWWIRCNYLGMGELEGRIKALREQL